MSFKAAFLILSTSSFGMYVAWCAALSLVSSRICLSPTSLACSAAPIKSFRSLALRSPEPLYDMRVSHTPCSRLIPSGMSTVILRLHGSGSPIATPRRRSENCSSLSFITSYVILVGTSAILPPVVRLSCVTATLDPCILISWSYARCFDGGMLYPSMISPFSCLSGGTHMAGLQW